MYRTGFQTQVKMGLSPSQDDLAKQTTKSKSAEEAEAMEQLKADVADIKAALARK